MNDKEYSSGYIKKIVAMLNKHEKDMENMSIIK
jgi:hypothetical protein